MDSQTREPVNAIWDSEAEAWYCPQCYHPLTEDGFWEDDNGSFVLWACNDCMIEFGRRWGDNGSPVANADDIARDALKGGE